MVNEKEANNSIVMSQIKEKIKLWWIKMQKQCYISNFFNYVAGINQIKFYLNYVAISQTLYS